MADDLKKTGKRDDSRINMAEDHEIDYWTDALNVSEKELREAVQAVGDNVEKVRQYLRK